MGCNSYTHNLVLTLQKKFPCRKKKFRRRKFFEPIQILLIEMTYDQNTTYLLIPRLGCHQKATASPLQGGSHRTKKLKTKISFTLTSTPRNRSDIHTHSHRHSSSHTSVLTRLPSILSHTSSILTISPHIHAWQGHYNPAHSGTLTSCSVS